MKNKYLISLLTSSAVALSVSPAWGESKTTSEITFACQGDRDVPVTIAKNRQGKTQTIFHWKQEVLPNSLDSHKLCDRTAAKLNKYVAEGNNLSSLRVETAEQLGLPAICITQERLVCDRVLFTLYPHPEPMDIAENTLTAILDRQIQNEHNTHNLESLTRCEQRGCQSLFSSFPINLFQN